MRDGVAQPARLSASAAARAGTRRGGASSLARRVVIGVPWGEGWNSLAARAFRPRGGQARRAIRRRWQNRSCRRSRRARCCRTMAVLGPCIAVQPQHVPTGGGINRMRIQGHGRQCRFGGRRSRLAVVSLRSQNGIAERACRSGGIAANALVGRAAAAAAAEAMCASRHVRCDERSTGARQDKGRARYTKVVATCMNGAGVHPHWQWQREAPAPNLPPMAKESTMHDDHPPQGRLAFSSLTTTRTRPPRCPSCSSWWGTGPARLATARRPSRRRRRIATTRSCWI